jgi:hypothetical protein
MTKLVKKPYTEKYYSEEWDKHNLEIFKSLNFKKDIIPIIKDCYYIASNDIEFIIPYSALVLKNIAIITDKEPMVITYKQWKSFKAYYKNNCTAAIKLINLNKLGI